MKHRPLLWLALFAAFSMITGVTSVDASPGSRLDAVRLQVSESAAANKAFPQHVTYTAGSIAPDHRSQDQLDDDVRAYYDRWKEDFVEYFGADWDGHPIYRVVWNPGQEDESISEAQGYGMVIAAHMAGHDPGAKELFDGLYRYVKLHPSAGDDRFMQWHTPTEVWHQAYAAFDGEADIAYGLVLADQQWGSRGDVNYRKEARDLSRAMSRVLLGPRSRLPMPGDTGKLDGRIDNEDQYTVRLSDLMVQNFRAFRVVSRDARWTRSVTAGQTAVASMQTRFSGGSGLVPDWVVPPTSGAPTLTKLLPAEPYTVEGQETDGKYGYNSARVPWRFGVDYLASGDLKSKAISEQISRWAEAATNGDPTQIVDGYELDGTAIGSRFAPAFVAPLGVAAMGQADQQLWLNAIYDSVRATHQNYFNDSVTLITMLIMTRNYIAVT